MKRKRVTDEDIVIDLIRYIEWVIERYGPVWMGWPDALWSQSFAMAKPVERIIGTHYYDPEDCAGHHFAVYVYNEVARNRLETF